MVSDWLLCLEKQLGINIVPLPKSVPDRAMRSHLLGMVSHRNEPMKLLMFGNPHETIQFHVLPSPHSLLFLGYPWLHRYNPDVDWSAGAILGWCLFCHQVCLKQTSSFHWSACPFLPFTWVPWIEWSLLLGHSNFSAPLLPIWLWN